MPTHAGSWFSLPSQGRELDGGLIFLAGARPQAGTRLRQPLRRHRLRNKQRDDRVKELRDVCVIPRKARDLTADVRSPERF